MATFFGMSVSGTTVDINTMGARNVIERNVQGNRVWADIEIEGHEWDISGGSGTDFSVAQLNCIPLVSSGNFIMGLTNCMINTPWRIAQTMSNVTGTLSYINLLSGGGWYDDYACQGSFDHMFLTSVYSGSRLEIRRIRVWDYFGTTYNPADRGNYFYGAYCVYNSTTIYTLEWQADDSFVIAKTVFNPDYTITTTDVYTSPTSFSFNSLTYRGWDLWTLQFVKYGTNEAIVAVVTLTADSGQPEYAMEFAIHHPLSGATTSIQKNLSSAGYDWQLSGFSVAPAIYQNKLIITMGVLLFGVWPPPGTDACMCPTFVVDTNSNTVTLYDNLVVDVDTETLVPYEETSCVDHDDGMYYFIAYRDSTVSYDLIGMPAAGGNLSIIQSSVGKIDFFQGYPKGYAVKCPSSVPEVCDVYSLPDMSVITTVNIVSAHGSPLSIDGNCFIDGLHGMIWNVTDTYLEGKSLGGGDPSRNIDFDWASLPWEYTFRRLIRVYVCAGVLMIGLWSREFSSSGAYQFDWYVLKENKPCEWP